jgi:glycosyltransferase involved in cell wall biosynthesis
MVALERWAYRSFDVVALTNPGAMQQIVARFPEAKATVISNGVDTQVFRPDLRDDGVRESLGVKDGEFLLGYCGLHGMAQGLDTVVAAAARLDHRPGIKIVMIGDGPCKADLVRDAARRGLRNLEFRDRLPKREMPAIVASCDAVVVPLSVRLPGTMPSKVYEALAAGTPVIIARGCEGESLILENGVGAAFEPGNPDELAEAILSLADDSGQLDRMRDDARRVASRFDRGLIATRTAAVLEAVYEGRQPPDPEW